MRMDGAGTENQLFGYFEISQATRQQAQYFYLPCCQIIRRYRCGGRVTRGYDRGWCLPLRGQSLLCRHHASLAPGDGKGLFAQAGAHNRDCAFIVGLLDEWDGYAARFT